MSALVSVTRVEGGVTRRLEGAAAYQFLFELDAAKASAEPLHRTPARRAERRPAGGPPSDTEAKVLRALADAADGLDRYDIAASLAISPDSVTWHMRRLTDRGHVVVEVGKHCRKRYRITDTGRDGLENPDPSQPCKHGGRMAEVFEWFRRHAGDRGASVNECAAGLGHNPQGLRGVIERLEGAHRLELIPSRPYRYRLPQGGPK